MTSSRLIAFLARTPRIVLFVAAICSATPTNPQPIGDLISIGSRKLHIHCTGVGSPTVVVENGGAAFSFDWELVQPEVARFMRICTYDRAGYAWSDPGPEFDTFDQAAHDLHLLTKLSTNSRQIMVFSSGHAIYFYRPEVVVRSIAAVATSAKEHSHLSSLE
jgi:hypothetical protein